MGTIVERKRSDGSTAFTAQIVVKQNGRIVHREAKTLDRKQAAYAWLEKREKELKAPGGLERKNDVPFRKVIARYLEEYEGNMGSTKAACLKKIMESDLGSINCSDMTSDKLVAFAKTLRVKAQTRANYFSHLSPIFSVGTPVWKYPLSKQEFENAVASMKHLKLVAKSAARDRRPTLDELDRLMEHFAGRRSDSAPMQKIITFAIFSTRRQEEITRIQWADLKGDRILVRAMKDPQNKEQNNVLCELTPEALQIINSMPQVNSAIFPISADAISAAFTKACKLLGIEDLHFHDLRHEGISRLFEMGRTIPQVAAISGHRSWSSLKRYTHIQASGDKYTGWRWTQ
jgi:integrase